MSARYSIERGETVIQEGRFNRRENSCRPHYYATFWPDKQSPRFRGYNQFSTKEAFQVFTQQEFARFMAGTRLSFSSLSCISLQPAGVCALLFVSAQGVFTAFA